MATNIVRATLILRNDLAATWAVRNPILAKGEIGAEIDTGLLKMGDGSTPFNDLDYINGGTVSSQGDNKLVTLNNESKLTIADYGKSYWRYDEENGVEVQVFESDLTKWPQTLELEVKNNAARWVVPKITYNRIQGTIDGALITLSRDPRNDNEASTKRYVDLTVAAAVSNAPHLKRQIVSQLPSGNYDANTIYMIKDTSATGADKYKEYIVINNELVQIGDTSVDLTNYVEKPSSFTNGNIVTFNNDGALIDSGVSINNVNQLTVATYYQLGGVRASQLDNYINVDSNGYMSVNRVATDKLYVPDNSEFILNGGSA